jgi:ATP-dependent Zn protease
MVAQLDNNDVTKSINTPEITKLRLMASPPFFEFVVVFSLHIVMSFRAQSIERKQNFFVHSRQRMKLASSGTEASA